MAKFTPDAAGTGEVATYYHQDHLGSTRLQTDVAGNAGERMDYEPFGTALAGSVTAEPYAHTGQRADAGTGLYYYGARFYDPAVGRLITVDSWTNLPDDERGYVVGKNPGGFNRYVYALNNPALYNDPTGHDVGPKEEGVYDEETSGYAVEGGELDHDTKVTGGALIVTGAVTAVQGVCDILQAATNPWVPNSSEQMRFGQGEVVLGFGVATLGAAKQAGEEIEDAVMRCADFIGGLLRDIRQNLNW